MSDRLWFILFGVLMLVGGFRMITTTLSLGLSHPEFTAKTLDGMTTFLTGALGFVIIRFQDLEEKLDKILKQSEEKKQK